jgi:cytoplasmic iron level regulating protein YaaA (DUF328/UPF0246 family)
MQGKIQTIQKRLTDLTVMAENAEKKGNYEAFRHYSAKAEGLMLALAILNDNQAK